MKPYPSQIYFTVVFFSVLTSVLLAFDLSAIPKGQVRSYLRPYLNAWAADQSLPATLLSDQLQPSIYGGAKFSPLILAQGKAMPGAPSVYLGTNLGANVFVTGAVQGGKYQGEYYTVLSVFTTYRSAQKPTAPAFSLQMTHVKGFTDLHYRTISLGATRKWQLGRSSISLGYFQHMTQVKFHIDYSGKGNYTTRKEYNFGLWQINYTRAIASQWQLGGELNLGWKGQTVSLSCSYFL